MVELKKFDHMYLVYHFTIPLTLSLRRSLSYRNQSIDLLTGFFMLGTSVMKESTAKNLERFSQKCFIIGDGQDPKYVSK